MFDPQNIADLERLGILVFFGVAAGLALWAAGGLLRGRKHKHPGER
jgi:hypothetical protein